MDNGWASSMSDNGGKAPGSTDGMDDGFVDFVADDPLGDEAAFPSTWQQLASPEISQE